MLFFYRNYLVTFVFFAYLSLFVYLLIHMAVVMGQASWLKKILQIQNTVFSSVHERSLLSLGSYLLKPDNMGILCQDRITAGVWGYCQWEYECLADPCWVYLVESVFAVYILDLTLAMVFSVVDIVQLHLHFSLLRRTKAPHGIR